MIKLLRTNSENLVFLELVKHLNADLAKRDGEVMAAFFGLHNKDPNLGTVIIAYEDLVPIGCGAFKEFDKETAEIKRMFVLSDKRSRGIASQILQALEAWAAELSFKSCILETGVKQPEAIRLYEKNHYAYIPNFPPYEGVKLSVCFRKVIKIV